jgi:hypothetical protein
MDVPESLLRGDGVQEAAGLECVPVSLTWVDLVVDEQTPGEDQVVGLIAGEDTGGDAPRTGLAHTMSPLQREPSGQNEVGRSKSPWPAIAGAPPSRANDDARPLRLL